MIYHKKNQGFTLAEAMAAMAILAFAAAAVTLPFTSAASVQQDTARRTLAARLAADKIEEIAADYDFTTYDGYTESEPVGQIKNAAGAIFTDPMYQNFIREVACTNATVAGVNLTWVSVTVYYKKNEDVTTEIITLGTLMGPG